MAKKLIKKTFGGDSDEKPWGSMSSKEKTSYLDNKAVNRTAENASRKQATIEHAKDYVKTSMQKTLNPLKVNLVQKKTGGVVKSKKK